MKLHQLSDGCRCPASSVVRWRQLRDGRMALEASCSSCGRRRAWLPQTDANVAAASPREVLVLEDPDPLTLLELGLRAAARRHPQLVAQVLIEELDRGGAR